MKESWYEPKPVNAPLRYPRRIPKRAVPSYIGEPNQALNLLMYKGGGGIARDYSGQGNHGTINGPKWTDEGIASWALKLDGSDDYIKVPYDNVFDSHKFTILSWLYPRNISESVKIPVDFFSYQNYGYTLDSRSGSRSYRLYITWDGGDDWGAGNTDVANDEWQLIGVTYDGSGPTANFYYNGSPDGSYTFSNDFDDVNGNLFYCIGKNQQGGYLFKGKLGIILHFAKVLTDSEVNQIYEDMKPLYI